MLMGWDLTKLSITSSRVKPPTAKSVKDYLIPFVSGSQQGHEHEYVKDRKYPQYQQHKYQKCGRGKHGYSPFCKMSNVLYIFMITVYFKNVKRFLHF